MCAPGDLATSAGPGGGIAIDQTSVYWVAAGTVMKVPADLKVGDLARVSHAEQLGLRNRGRRHERLLDLCRRVLKVSINGGVPETLASGQGEPGRSPWMPTASIGAIWAYPAAATVRSSALVPKMRGVGRLVLVALGLVLASARARRLRRRNSVRRRRRFARMSQGTRVKYAFPAPFGAALRPVLLPCASSPAKRRSNEPEESIELSQPVALHLHTFAPSRTASP